MIDRSWLTYRNLFLVMFPLMVLAAVFRSYGVLGFFNMVWLILIIHSVVLELRKRSRFVGDAD